MSLKECPSCGADNIFVPLVPAVGYHGTLLGFKSEGFCNNGACDQLLWYYPSTGRVTRRSVGLTLREWRQRRVSLDVVNALRANEGMSLLVEDAGFITPLSPTSQFSITQDDWPWYTRLFDTVQDWYYWIRALILSPFRRRSRKDADLEAGISTVNEVRVDQMLSPAAVLPKDEPSEQ